VQVDRYSDWHRPVGGSWVPYRTVQGTSP